MIRTFISTISIVLLVFFITACSVQTEEKQSLISRDKLLEGFVTPADSVQTAVYWYWISDNISKEGVVKDLHAMKAAGINRAFIGNIGLDNVPYGKVKMLSEEWWEILHLALKTATELNIEIGIFNSPGWSQSGGPWVKSENAMRYLTPSEIKVQGSIKFYKLYSCFLYDPITLSASRCRWNYLDVSPIQDIHERRIKPYAAPSARLLNTLKSGLEEIKK